MASDVGGALRRVCSHVTDHGLSEELPPGLQTELETVLSPESLSQAFTDNKATGRDQWDIDYAMVVEAFEPLKEQDDLLLVISRIVKETYKQAGATLRQDPANIPLLRAVLVLLLCPVYKRPDEPWCREIIVDLAHTLINIEKIQSLRNTFQTWLLKDERVLRQAVRIFHNGLQSLRKSTAYLEFGSIVPLLDTLKFLNTVNENGGCPVPRRLFYLDDILEKGEGNCDVMKHIIFHAAVEFALEQGHLQESDRKKFVTWLDYPFTLNVRTKWTFLSVEAAIIQDGQVRETIFSSMMQAFMNPYPWMCPSLFPTVPPSLTLVFSDVNRHDIIASAMNNLDKYENKGPNVWLKPLEVKFGHGERAMDAGGPSKEFFQLLFDALMDQQLAIFRRIDEKSVSSSVWFNPEYINFDTLRKIGLLFALLLFNGAIVTVPFPVLLYELLLTPREVNSQDVPSFDPVFTKSIESLRREPDLTKLDLDFKDLETGGEYISVDMENLERYIEKKKMHKLAPRQLVTFCEGFRILSQSSRILNEVFKAEELRDVILGEIFDWDLFEKSTLYKPPYSRGHPVIETFWRVFHALDEPDKRLFLKYITGADHVPVNGFQSLEFTIKRLDTRQKFNDIPANRHPSANTCPGYISLHLPEYETDDDLRLRLLEEIHMDMIFNE